MNQKWTSNTRQITTKAKEIDSETDARSIIPGSQYPGMGGRMCARTPGGPGANIDIDIYVSIDL